MGKYVSIGKAAEMLGVATSTLQDFGSRNDARHRGPLVPVLENMQCLQRENQAQHGTTREDVDLRDLRHRARSRPQRGEEPRSVRPCREFPGISLRRALRL